MYLSKDEKATPEIRFNTWNSVITPFLEQRWECREGNNVWLEWRKVQIVSKEPGERTPISAFVYD